MSENQTTTIPPVIPRVETEHTATRDLNILEFHLKTGTSISDFSQLGDALTRHHCGRHLRREVDSIQAA